MTPEDRAKLVAARETGTTVRELAEQFGIHRTTVAAQLQHEGIATRRGGATPDKRGPPRHGGTRLHSRTRAGRTPLNEGRGVDGKRPLPLVSVLVGFETFAGRLCELADGTVVPPNTLDDLLPQGFIERIVYDGPNRIMEVGEQRLFTGALRRAIQARDRHCTHPGCRVPAHRCQVDHIEPSGKGGMTEQLNGRLLCPAHHRWRHRQTEGPAPP